MGNSFNISVAPEIAAVSALVTTVDTVVDLIRSADVPNIQTNIDAVDTIVELKNYRKFMLPSDVLLHSNDPRSDSNNLAYEKVKETKVDFTGSFRAYWEFRNFSANEDCWTKIYINDIAVGVEKYYGGAAFDPYTDDNDVVYGDLVQLWAKGSSGFPSVMTQNFRLKGDVNLYAITTIESI